MKRCSMCLEEKFPEAFGLDKHSKDGRNSRCKLCLLKKRREVFFEYQENGISFCSHCKLEKPCEDFVRNRRRPRGVHVYCKSCFNKINKDRRKNNPTWWEIQKNKNFKNWRKKIGLSEEDVPRRRKAGEGYISRDGYLSYKIKGHPCSDKNGRVQASHLVMYEKIGRPLYKHETVHHKNGIRDDNRIENLELWSRGQPYGQRVEDKVQWCIEFLSQYGYSVSKS